MSKSNDPRPPVKIKLRFVRQNSRPIEVTTENYLEAEVGQTIQVVSDPIDPTRVQLTDWKYDHRTPLLALLVVALTRFWSRPPVEAGT